MFIVELQDIAEYFYCIWKCSTGLFIPGYWYLFLSTIALNFVSVVIVIQTPAVCILQILRQTFVVW